MAQVTTLWPVGTPGHKYPGFSAKTEAVPAPATFAETPRYVRLKPTSNLTDLLRRPDRWLEIEGGRTITTPARLGNKFRVLLSEDCNVDPPHDPHPGQKVTWRFEQPSAGGVTVTFNPDKFVTVMDLPVPVNEDGAAVTYVEATYNDEGEVWEIVGVPGGASSTYATIVEITSNYTVVASDTVILADASGGDITISLAAGVDGRQLLIKKISSTGTVTINGSGTEDFDTGPNIELTADWRVTGSLFQSVLLGFYTDQWYELLYSTWDTLPTTGFPIMMALDARDTSFSGDGYFAFGTGDIEQFATLNGKVKVVAAIAGTVHSLKVANSLSLFGSDTYDITLYKNGVATDLTCQLNSSAQTAEDTTNRIAVAEGDLLTVFADSTGSGAVGHLATTFVFDATYQPMFATSEAVTGLFYSSVQSGNGQDTTISPDPNKFATIFPCAGTLQNFVVTCEALTTSGNEVTVRLRKWNSGTSAWDDQITIAVDYDTYGTSRTYTDATQDIAAGDILQWEYERSGTGSLLYTTVGCQFVPDTPGDIIITGNLERYSATDSETGAMIMGSTDDFSSTTPLSVNIPVPTTGTASNLYVAMEESAGAADRWVEVEILKNGAGSGLLARMTHPSVAANDTSNSATFTDGTDDIGVKITNSGDIGGTFPIEFVAWGFVYRA